MNAERSRMAIVVVLASAGVSVVSALAMRDHVALPEIIILWFGGFGSGVAIARLITQRRE